MNELKIYELVLTKGDDDETGVDCISIVDCPAINRDFLKFSKQPPRFEFSKDKMVISGPVMIPNIPIYRESAAYGQHYVKFSRATIEEVQKRYFKNGYNLNWNLQHEVKTEDVYLFESYIIDRKKGIAPSKQWSDLPDGTWMISVKVENEELWHEIMQGRWNGFSVEILAEYKFNKHKQISEDEQELQFYKDAYKQLCGLHL